MHRRGHNIISQFWKHTETCISLQTKKKGAMYTLWGKKCFYHFHVRGKSRDTELQQLIEYRKLWITAILSLSIPLLTLLHVQKCMEKNKTLQRRPRLSKVNWVRGNQAKRGITQSVCEKKKKNCAEFVLVKSLNTPKKKLDMNMFSIALYTQKIRVPALTKHCQPTMWSLHLYYT